MHDQESDPCTIMHCTDVRCREGAAGHIDVVRLLLEADGSGFSTPVMAGVHPGEWPRRHAAQACSVVFLFIRNKKRTKRASSFPERGTMVFSHALNSKRDIMKKEKREKERNPSD
jgi:hypothetical protein